MQNIHIQRYADPSSHGWAGWIELEDRSWILFIRVDGLTAFFPERDPQTGAVL